MADLGGAASHLEPQPTASVKALAYPAAIDEEKRYCDRWLAARYEERVRLLNLLVPCTHILSFLILPLVVNPLVSKDFRVCHASLLAIYAAASVFRRRRWSRAFRVSYYMHLIIMLSFYQWMVYLASSVLPTQDDMLMANAGCFIYASVGLQLHLSRNRLSITLIALGLMAIAPWTMGPQPGGAVVTAIFWAFIGFTAGWRLLIDARLGREARSEYRLLSQVVPAHIIRHTAPNTTDLLSLFKPSNKYCVCVASDWRNYQQLSSRLAPSQLAMSLDSYYLLCHNLLAATLPEGNYFTDWIADELFVVMFQTEDVDAAQLAHAGVRFAMELAAARPDFARIHGLPLALDVGVSAGSALVGLMGPPNLRKATAIGEVPGRARRLQTVGKLLRQYRGECDRVVFGSECKSQLPAGFGAQCWAVPDDQAIRDLPDRELYFIESPAPAPSPSKVEPPLHRAA